MLPHTQTKMKASLSLILSLLFLPSLAAFQSSIHSPKLRHGPTAVNKLELRASNIESSNAAAPSAQELKQKLLKSVTDFRFLKKQDGDVAIEFGVKGGELDKDTRAPQKIDFFSISKAVGEKALEIQDICQTLSQVSSIDEPTRFLGDKENGDKAPLNGPWKLLFSTAADANFNNNSTRGEAKVQNIVNAAKGTITNVIDFANKEDGSEPLLKQLNVVIKATAVSAKRVELQFKYAKAILTKFFFLKVRWPLYIPVPGPFITRCIVFLSRLFRFGKAGGKKVPKAYFDVVYLDQELRVHKTGEDNLFVQAKESWNDAKPLLI